MKTNKNETVGEAESFAEKDTAETLRVIEIALRQSLPELDKKDPVFQVLHFEHGWDLAKHQAKAVEWPSIEKYYGSLNHYVRLRAPDWKKKEENRSRKVQFVSIDDHGPGFDDGDRCQTGDNSIEPGLYTEPERPREAEDIGRLLSELFEKAEVPLHERVALMSSLSLPGRKNSHSVAKGTWKGELVLLDNMWAFNGAVSVLVRPGEDPAEATERMKAIEKLFYNPSTGEWHKPVVDRKQMSRYCGYALKKLATVV
jgi:DNA-directed RNA polymerase subunit H (RpoH/RPB5)